jgi:symplekin
MEKAVADEKRRKAAVSDSRKRPSSAIDSLDNKRIKLDNDTSPSTTNSAAFLSSFDFTSLPATLITNLIVSNLEAFTEAQLIELVNAYRQSRGIQPSAPSVTLGPALSAAGTSISSGLNGQTEISRNPALVSSQIKAEAVDPLQMDIDEDEMEFEPEKLNEEVCRN